MKRAALILLILWATWSTTLAAATVYGIRYKAGPDGKLQRIFWLTSATSVELEVPGHGTVLVHVEDDELYNQANGDSTGGRDLTVRGLVVNQLRVGFEK